MALLTTLATALSGKAAATLAGATLVGGGLAVAADNAQPSDEAAPVVESNLEAAEDADLDVDLVTQEIDTEEQGPTDDESENEGRSADVHDALTGGEAEPGDEDFGEIVSENARGEAEGSEGGREFGQNVAETARDGAGEEASADGRARADEAREGAGEQAETSEDRGQAEAGPETGTEQSEQGRDRAPDTPADDAAQNDDDRRGGGPGNRP